MISCIKQRLVFVGLVTLLSEHFTGHTTLVAKRQGRASSSLVDMRVELTEKLTVVPLRPEAKP